MSAFIAALAVGTASALLFARRRRWADALLALLAGAALAGLVGGFTLPAGAARSVPVSEDSPSTALDTAARASVGRDGLRAAQWQDLPARPLEWTPGIDDGIRLSFPRTLALGRIFELAVQRGAADAARLQLLAENGQVLAESAGDGAALGVQWLPPVAEAMVLEARLLDGGGKVLAKGPVPLVVRDFEPLRVQGRFASPSFDARVLNDLLAASNALLDWQVTLGKSLTRSETARENVAAPDLLVMDAAQVERMPDAARAALLAQVGEGRPLLVLGGSAGEPALWARLLQLELQPEADGARLAGPLALAAAPFNPARAAGGAWRAAGPRTWTRDWGKGRITWLGVAGWHRYAISEPRALGLWWQGVLDQAGVRRGGGVVWEEPADMPLPGERLALCAQGVEGEADIPSLRQRVRWQRRPDVADAACIAVWPEKAGWLEVSGHKVYVFGRGDWPLWQKAQRRDATALYAARTPAAPAKGAAPLPAWPFGVAFAAAMLGLWWRERR